MNIIITKGTGDGRTEISAFDMALKNAGICNYNLIQTSLYQKIKLDNVRYNPLNIIYF